MIELNFKSIKSVFKLVVVIPVDSNKLYKVKVFFNILNCVNNIFAVDGTEAAQVPINCDSALAENFLKVVSIVQRLACVTKVG